jgi:hypothetical protein
MQSQTNVQVSSGFRLKQSCRQAKRIAAFTIWRGLYRLAVPWWYDTGRMWGPEDAVGYGEPSDD